jgi:hypothetical protein
VHCLFIDIDQISIDLDLPDAVNRRTAQVFDLVAALQPGLDRRLDLRRAAVIDASGKRAWSNPIWTGAKEKNPRLL